MPSQRNSVARSALWNHAGKLTDYIAWYCSSVLIARGLGVELNGVLASMMSGVHLVLAFSSLGLEVAVNKAIPQLVGDDVAPQVRAIIRRTAAARVFLYVAIGILFVFGSTWLLAGEPSLAPENLVVLFLYGLFRGLASLAAVLLIARWHADRAAIINGTTRLLELVLLGVLYRAGMSLPSVITVLSATFALQVAGYIIAARRDWFGAELHVPMRPIWIFGTIFWANTVVDYFLGRQGDILFLTLLSPFASSPALYDVSYSILQAGSMAITVGFSGVTLAAFARLALGERGKLDQFYGSLVRITTFLMIPVLGFLFVATPEIIGFIYSDAYSGAAVVLQVMIAFRILARLFAGGENADYLLAIDRVGELVGIGVVGAGVTVALHLILIPRFDVVGAAWAAGLGTLAANVLAAARVRRHGSAQIQYRTWGIMVVMAALAGGVVLLLPPSGSEIADLVIKGVAFPGSVFGLAMLFRPLRQVDADAADSVSSGFRAVLSRFARP
jgi:O-antigen/teichoic acid export membrane protein